MIELNKIKRGPILFALIIGMYLSGVSDPQAPAEIANGLAAGINNAFIFGGVIALVAFVLGLFLRKGKSPELKQVAE